MPKLKSKKLSHGSDPSAEIKGLRDYWNFEKEAYKNVEIGSGVQKFTKMLFNSSIFGLREGKLETKIEERNREYICEKGKKGRRADMIIYIDRDIRIPVEVEKYSRIDDGRVQIIQYQVDWEKHYGILTDGYTWRFYNNNTYREFNLDVIFNDTQTFTLFWEDYIKSENYYINYFESKNDKYPEKKIINLNVEENRERFFNDITDLIRRFAKKTKLEGYFDDIEKGERNKKALEISYAYIIQFILYKTLVDNRFNDFDQDYKKVDKAMLRYLCERNYGKMLNIIEGITSNITKDIYRPFREEQSFIDEKLRTILRKLENSLSDVAPWLDIFVFIKSYNFANVRNEIFGYVYENYLKVIHGDEDKGQYFTDPSIVNFMLDEIGYTKDKIVDSHKNISSENSLSIIDPACGSGTFLYSAVDRLMDALPQENANQSKYIEQLINQHVFGLDIAEFPLYLAEMSMIMRLLPIIINEKYNSPIEKKIKLFETTDSIAEFINDDLDSGDTLISFMRDEKDLKECKDSIKNNQIPRRRFDYVIGNPPYISYNRCCRQKLAITQLIKNKEARLNDIYGSNLHSVPERRKVYSPKPNLYAFFIALGIGLLKENGKLCYIIPQTVLVDNDLDVIRYHLSTFVTIEKIITFRGKMFINRGISQSEEVVTSSLIFVIKNTPPSDNHNVELIHYTESEKDISLCLDNIRKGKKISKKKISQLKLRENIYNWNFYFKDEDFIDFYDKYRSKNEDFSLYYDHNKAREYFGDKFFIDGGTNIQKKDIIFDEVDNPKDYYKIPSFKARGHCIDTDGYYPKNTKIKIAQGSQGLKACEPRYKIMWKYINFDGFYYIEGEDILPIYQQFSIASNNKKEILYLLSILGSTLMQSILHNLLKIENEDRLNLLMGVTSIKELIRVPVITDENRLIKDKLIKLSGDLLDLEKNTLSDHVDFSRVLIQKFNDAKIRGNNLVLISEDSEVMLPINSKTLSVVRAFEAIKKSKKGMTLSALKKMPVIDKWQQSYLKREMDNLIYQLYQMSNKEIDLIEKNKDPEEEFYAFMIEFLKAKTRVQKRDLIQNRTKQQLNLIIRGMDSYEESGISLSEKEQDDIRNVRRLLKES